MAHTVNPNEMNYCVECKFCRDFLESRCLNDMHRREAANNPVSGDSGFRMAEGGFSYEEFPLCDDIRYLFVPCPHFEPKTVANGN